MAASNKNSDSAIQARFSGSESSAKKEEKKIRKLKHLDTKSAIWPSISIDIHCGRHLCISGLW
jgi:hypothetical protein